MREKFFHQNLQQWYLFGLLLTPNYPEKSKEEVKLKPKGSCNSFSVSCPVEHSDICVCVRLELTESLLLSFAFLVSQMMKNLPAMQETRVRSLEKGMATHSSILAWRILWAEEPGWLQSMGSQRIRHDWARYCAKYFPDISPFNSHSLIRLVLLFFPLSSGETEAQEKTNNLPSWGPKSLDLNVESCPPQSWPWIRIRHGLTGCWEWDSWLASFWQTQGKWQHWGLLVSRIVPGKYLSAIPKLFGTRDWFHGRLFFRGPEVGGWFQDYFKCIMFVVHVVPDLMSPLIW